MAITSLDQYIAAPKQLVEITKTASMTGVAANFQDVLALVGNPGAGVLAGTDTAAGVVPTDATAGFPAINAFGAGATGYLSRAIFSSTVAGRLRVNDCLFKAGAYTYYAETVLASQPSYAGRVPAGDYKGLELWFEAVTAFTGNPTVQITYTDQDGNAGHVTGLIALGIAPIVGRMVQIPLAAGDTGIQKIEGVYINGPSAGTWNILVLRPLWEGRVRSANDGDTHDFLKTGMVQVFADSALLLQLAADSTVTGIPSVLLEVVNG